MSLTKLRIQLLLVFLSLAGLFLFFLFKLLPHWGTSLPPLTAGMLTLLVLTSILLSLALIYREPSAFTARLVKKPPMLRKRSTVMKP